MIISVHVTQTIEKSVKWSGQKTPDKHILDHWIIGISGCAWWRRNSQTGQWNA